MIFVEYEAKGSSQIFKVEVSVEDYFGPVGEGETYERDGIPKHLDIRDYVEPNNDLIRRIKANIFGEIIIQKFCENGVLHQHTTHSDGSEMLVIQSDIGNGLVHSVKLTKQHNSEWVTKEVVILDDGNGIVESLL